MTQKKGEDMVRARHQDHFTKCMEIPKRRVCAVFDGQRTCRFSRFVRRETNLAFQLAINAPTMHSILLPVHCEKHQWIGRRFSELCPGDCPSEHVDSVRDRLGTARFTLYISTQCESRLMVMAANIGRAYY
jgi:hypothetical protein